MKANKYALVIGGTGMLEETCHWLVEQNYFISVVNRQKYRFEQMRKSSPKPDRFHNISVDYHYGDQLQEKIIDAIDQFGYPELVLSWIHSSAPEALPLIIRILKRAAKPWTLFHVQSSSTYFVKENTPVPDNCQYRRVYLGFIMEDEDSRWLTNNEIASGVIRAIQSNHPETIVGTIEPWKMRP